MSFLLVRHALMYYVALARACCVSSLMFGVCMQADITLRTMSDGTLARVLLQPEMLNPALPASELTNVSFSTIPSICYGELLVVKPYLDGRFQALKRRT